MVDTTANGLRYPESTDHTRLWEHIRDLASDIDPHLSISTYQVFESDDTWTKPDNLKYVIVECVGGGGAGGGAVVTGSGECSAGQGGTGAFYCRSVILASALASTENITVGQGGAAVVGDTGGDGGFSSFGSLVSAPGGLGGIVQQNSNSDNYFEGNLSTGSGVGDLIVRGGHGGGAERLPSVNCARGGYGGDSLMGTGARVSQGQGFDGLKYGGGGGGGTRRGSTSPAIDGGPGGDGVVIVAEYY